jgi:RimJ/RimL family protein N-acetyltransferase
MVRLEKYEHRFFEALSYQLDEKQSNYTASVDYCLNTRRDLEDPQKTLITILYHDQPVGFFILDTGDDKYRLTENPNSVLVRSLSINPEYQGRGIGKEAMNLASQYVKDHFDGIHELVLAVNFRNEGAYTVYMKSGFIDDGMIVDGRKGPQHVLAKRL